MTTCFLKLLSILILLVGISLIANAQWEWQWPLPHGNTMYSVKFVDENKGFAVGGGGTIQYTNDGGQTWEFQEAGTSDGLIKVDFTDSQHGWIVSDAGKILRTTDGGGTWNINQFSANRLNCVEFIDNYTGWICGNDGVIARTDDGGVTFHIQPSGVLTNFNCIRFYDNLNGYCSGYGDTAFLKTVDGGISWIPVVTGFDDDVMAVDFKSLDTIVAIGQSNYILRSYDSGNTWNITDHYIGTGFQWVKIFQDKIYIPTGYGRILRSSDFGNNWVLDTIPVNGWLFGVDVLQNGSYYVTGSGGSIIYKHDDESTWELLQGVNDYTLWEVCAPEPDNVWVVGGLDKIMHSMDGGLSWVYDSLNAYRYLENMYFTDADHGWIVGSAGTGHLYRTVDAGENWELEYSGGPGGYIHDIQFINDSIGWIASQGTVMKSVNGGSTWQPLIDTVLNTRSIFFTDENHGWFACLGKTLGFTTDGGLTWTFRDLEGSNVLLDKIFFLNNQEGWCSGQRFSENNRQINSTLSSFIRIIWHTLDGGLTWQEITQSDELHIFSDLYFFDELNGYSTGRGVFRTTDGGKTWERQIGIQSGLVSIAFTDEMTAWACGPSAIMHTSNGGVNTTPKINTSNDSFYSTVYPNPSNGDITFSFDLPEESSIEIVIVSSDGRLVDAITTPKYPTGKNSFNWTTGKIPPGFYICHLKAGKKFSVQKLIVE